MSSCGKRTGLYFDHLLFAFVHNVPTSKHSASKLSYIAKKLRMYITEILFVLLTIAIFFQSYVINRLNQNNLICFAAYNYTVCFAEIDKLIPSLVIELPVKLETKAT